MKCVKLSNIHTKQFYAKTCSKKISTISEKYLIWCFLWPNLLRLCNFLLLEKINDLVVFSWRFRCQLCRRNWRDPRCLLTTQVSQDGEVFVAIDFSVSPDGEVHTAFWLLRYHQTKRSILLSHNFSAITDESPCCPQTAQLPSNGGVHAALWLLWYHQMEKSVLPTDYLGTTRWRGPCFPLSIQVSPDVEVDAALLPLRHHHMERSMPLWLLNHQTERSMLPSKSAGITRWRGPCCPLSNGDYMPLSDHKGIIRWEVNAVLWLLRYY